MLAVEGFVEIAGLRLEYRFSGPQPGDAPCIVLLHEGLGCAAMWGGFAQALSAATGAGVFAWSRAGYGASNSIILPRPQSYMHDEAQVYLKVLLDAIGFQRGILLGHSDGASIAAIYAGMANDPRIDGISLMAPHFFVEDISIDAIRLARRAYVNGDLRQKLARWHSDVDAAFLGWNDAWLDPEFRAWNLAAYLQKISIPVQIVQGEDDQYGTIAQIEMAQRECMMPVDVVMLPYVRHSPHREAAERTLAAVSSFFHSTCADAAPRKQG